MKYGKLIFAAAALIVVASFGGRTAVGLRGARRGYIASARPAAAEGRSFRYAADLDKIVGD
jgi:hypothetical protein